MYNMPTTQGNLTDLPMSVSSRLVRISATDIYHIPNIIIYYGRDIICIYYKQCLAL